MGCAQTRSAAACCDGCAACDRRTRRVHVNYLGQEGHLLIGSFMSQDACMRWRMLCLCALGCKRAASRGVMACARYTGDGLRRLRRQLDARQSDGAACWNTWLRDLSVGSYPVSSLTSFDGSICGVPQAVRQVPALSLVVCVLRIAGNEHGTAGRQQHGRPS